MRVVSTGLRCASEIRKPTNGARSALTLGFAVLSLGGCMALAEKNPPVAEPAPAPVMEVAPLPVVAMAEPVVKPKKIVRAKPVSKSLRDKPAPVDPDQLIGMEPGAVRKLLGAPMQVRNDQLSREWIYATDRCSFRVFFYPNLNAASFRVLKYGSSGGNGEMIDVSDVCIRHILMARKNATD
jgi:hypothetical protein